MNKETDQKEQYLQWRRAGWNDALHEMKVELLDGVAAHHWLAQKVIEIVYNLKQD